jgi:exopolyphosphatase/guanosine-5'-triphosphate,3'-diphosphate pyrophosphatase
LKVSVIDLGFNSLKLVTYLVREDRSFYVVAQKSVSAMLGEGMENSGYLQLRPMLRTIQGLTLFREMIDSESIRHVLPIATSAVREAKNKEEFLKRVRRECGFNFRVLSDREEAFFSYAGAFRSIFESDVLFFDLGGGSLEIVNTSNFLLRKSLSLPLGALRLSQIFSNHSGVLSKKNYLKMRKYILDLLPDESQLALRRATGLIGVGGTVRALATIDQSTIGYPLEKVHRYSLTRDALDYIQDMLIERKVNDIAKLDFVGKERAKSLAAGYTVVKVLMEKFNFEELIVSTQGLRDGILAAFLQNPSRYDKGKLIEKMALVKPRFGNPLRSSEGFLSLLISKGLLSQKEKNIIVAAAGHILSGLPPYRPFTLFHILLDEDLNMSHHSQLLMALAIVRNLRPKTSEWLYERYKSIVEPTRKNRIKRIAAILRLVTLLEELKSKVKAKISNGSLSLEISMGKTPNQHRPTELLGLAIAELSEALDISVELNGENYEKACPISIKEN